MPTPVVLDVDTGVDDACALLLAARHPGIDLKAVSARRRRPRTPGSRSRSYRSRR